MMQHEHILLLSQSFLKFLSKDYHCTLIQYHGILYDQTHTREIQNYGGVINKMPLFSALVVFFAMANSGLPGTSGFVGEFMVLLGTYQANTTTAVFATTGVILGCAYSL